jgi:hypothetical protein
LSTGTTRDRSSQGRILEEEQEFEKEQDGQNHREIVREREENEDVLSLETNLDFGRYRENRRELSGTSSSGGRHHLFFGRLELFMDKF